MSCLSWGVWSVACWRNKTAYGRSQQWRHTLPFLLVVDVTFLASNWHTGSVTGVRIVCRFTDETFAVHIHVQPVLSQELERLESECKRRLVQRIQRDRGLRSTSEDNETLADNDVKTQITLLLDLLALCRWNPPVALTKGQGLYSLSGKSSYRKISWSLEAARFGFRIFQSFWNLTDTSTAALPVRFQSNMIITTSNLVVSKLHEILR